MDHPAVAAALAAAADATAPVARALASARAWLAADAEAPALLVAAALVALLPRRPHATYRTLLASASPDASPYTAGKVSRRWLVENMLLLLALLAGGAELAQQAWAAARARALSAALLLNALGFCVVLYSSVLYRVLGDYGDTPLLVPRHQSPDTRRERAVHYRMRLRGRLAPLRWWWVAYGGLCAARLLRGAQAAGCGAADASAAAAWVARTARAVSDAGSSRAAVHALLAAARVAAAALPLRAVHCLATDPATQAAAGARWAQQLAAASEDAPLSWAGAGAALLALAHAASLVAAHAAPLGVTAIAAHIVFRVRASDFLFRTGATASSWLWPSGQVGETPWQVAPPVISEPSYVAAGAVASVVAAAAASAAASAAAAASVTTAAASAAESPAPPSSADGSSAEGDAPASPAVARRRRSGSAAKLASPPPSGASSARKRRSSAGAGRRGSLSGGLSIDTPLDNDGPDGRSAAFSSGGGFGAGAASSAAASYPLTSPPAIPRRLRAAPSSGYPRYTLPDSAHLIAATAATGAPPLVVPVPGSPSTAAGTAVIPPGALGSHRLRIAIITVGTRGDVQPFIALGSHLRDCGHSVVISSTDDFEAAVVAAGLEFGRTGAPRLDQPPAWVEESTTTMADMIRASRASFTTMYGAVADGFAAAVAGADVIVGTSMTVTFALNLAEASGYTVPVWIAKLAPDLPSAAFSPLGHFPSSWGTVNLWRALTHWVGMVRAVGDVGVTGMENAFRARLGLGPIAAGPRLEQMSHTPMLLGWSSHLMPTPQDYPRWAVPCGFWLSNDADEHAPLAMRSAAAGLPEQLTRFVSQEEFALTPEQAAAAAAATAAGQQPPVPDPALGRRLPLAVVTFGSMVHADDALIDNLVTALRSRNFQVLVLTGWKGEAKAAAAAAASAQQASADGGSGASSTPGGRRRRGSVGGSAAAAALATAAASSQPAPAAPVGSGKHAGDPRVLYWPEAPHHWLFDHAYMIVHHGGAGTTGRALASGKPSLIIPVLRWFDQPLWGWLVSHANVGRCLLGAAHTRHHGSVRALSAVVDIMTAGGFERAPHTGSVIGDRANALGALVRAQPAAANAQAALESCLCNRMLPPAEADAVHPLVLTAARVAAPGVLAALTPEQRMCVRCCVPCARVRRAMAAAAAASSGSAEGGHDGR